jgi:2-polyprenyl-3-methyl-5-hydroxy-6-metoxy-1,4-benzoquinol methylase
MDSSANNYYSQSRAELLALLPQNIHLQHVLDVGCGTGMAGRLLKEKFAVEKVTGIEKMREYAIEAQKRLDEVLIMDAESPDVPFQSNQFDLILMGDVLEHMYDPWTALKRYGQFLKPAGLLLLSIPNIQYWRIIIGLLFGQWRYKSCGILDRSHIRFFTITSAIEMAKNMQINIIKIKYSMGFKGRIINSLTMGLFKGLLTFQIFLLLQNRDKDI